MVEVCCSVLMENDGVEISNENWRCWRGGQCGGHFLAVESLSGGGLGGARWGMNVEKGDGGESYQLEEAWVEVCEGGWSSCVGEYH